MKEAKTIRVAIYGRVSTAHHQDPEMQMRELREYISHRGWILAGEFVDKGFSGSKDSRPALNRIMVAARQREIDAVLVWKLDRWGRSLTHLVNSLAELEAIGVAFVSLRDNLDLTTPAGRLMFQLLAAMGEFEKSLIVERVNAGLRNARHKGIKLGRPARKLDIRRIQSLRSSGCSLREISKKLDIPLATICRALRSQIGQHGSAPPDTSYILPQQTLNRLINTRFGNKRARQSAT